MQMDNWCDTYRSQMDDALRGHGASHEADKLQLRAVLRHGPHRLIGHLRNRAKQESDMREEKEIKAGSVFFKGRNVVFFPKSSHFCLEAAVLFHLFTTQTVIYRIDL